MYNCFIWPVQLKEQVTEVRYYVANGKHTDCYVSGLGSNPNGIDQKENFLKISNKKNRYNIMKLSR